MCEGTAQRSWSDSFDPAAGGTHKRLKREGPGDRETGSQRNEPESREPQERDPVRDPGGAAVEQDVEAVRNGGGGTKRVRQTRVGGHRGLRALEGRQTSGEEPWNGSTPSGGGEDRGRAQGAL